MVKMRLTRMGKKKAPYYRIVVADARVQRDGKYIEQVGTYDAVKNPAIITVDRELAMKWLENGAQPTDTVRNILSKEGIMAEFAAKKNA